ncbi:hypothetical protein [Metabacillus malikii]|uniref:Uncharacterized protein n=1 Tax=Metabacillus malikii TaxID=1504265 RepID=A0ABT9Z9V3_9BACI|nr:hypothetical protein [Metabacillus malikii]MDQ0229028.1 hypothetical protein [Metabacillus malikii]
MSFLKKSSFLIQLAITIMVIFGGIFLIRYVRTGELLIDQLIGFASGGILLVATVGWRKIVK